MRRHVNAGKDTLIGAGVGATGGAIVSGGTALGTVGAPQLADRG
jgi:hypothetical protein